MRGSSQPSTCFSAVERVLQQRREILRVLPQQLDELVGVVDRQVGVLRPAGEHRPGAPLPAAVAELLGEVAAVQGELALCFDALGGDLLQNPPGGLELRPAQHRHDALERPVVKGPLVLELQRADRVGDVLQRILDRVRVRVHRVDHPPVAGHVVLGEADAVNGRVAQVDVGRRHVDLGAQDHAAFRVGACTHLAEQAQVFLDRPVAVRRVAAGRGQRAARLAHLLGGLLVDVGVAGGDQVLGEAVHVLEVI
jgi:hypothetical protein